MIGRLSSECGAVLDAVRFARARHAGWRVGDREYFGEAIGRSGRDGAKRGECRALRSAGIANVTGI